MKWTLERPTEVGYYWRWTLTREGELDTLTCEWVHPQVNHPKAVQNMGVALWYGPIALPPEPETFTRKRGPIDLRAGV